MNKSVIQHLEELIDFYKTTSISDPEYLKKLIVRNLGDVKRRYEKYVDPKLKNIVRVNELIKNAMTESEILGTGVINLNGLLNLLNGGDKG